MERMSEIDLEALGRAIARLEEALAAYRDDPQTCWCGMP